MHPLDGKEYLFEVRKKPISCSNCEQNCYLASEIGSNVSDDKKMEVVIHCKNYKGK